MIVLGPMDVMDVLMSMILITMVYPKLLSAWVELKLEVEEFLASM